VSDQPGRTCRPEPRHTMPRPCCGSCICPARCWRFCSPPLAVCGWRRSSHRLMSAARPRSAVQLRWWRPCPRCQRPFLARHRWSWCRWWPLRPQPWPTWPCRSRSACRLHVSGVARLVALARPKCSATTAAFHSTLPNRVAASFRDASLNSQDFYARVHPFLCPSHHRGGAHGC